ncbi:MAG: sigma-54-dependent Fis family transcriptional regulator [bacterium]|nr:sigma-54-dependent Fis family transcriptional regulator [bacterium]
MPNDTNSSYLKNLKDKKSAGIKALIDQVAVVDTNLLVYGETGVGKDFWVDTLCRVAGNPRILKLHCGDVPENLLDSEWFGYTRGAFTGALEDRDGKWKQAEGGILFLNGIDLLSLNMQAKLLRIIERKKYFPLGTYNEVDVNARFVFSADRDIRQKVRDGSFREDLYYRISVYNILVPPLRERKNDILPLFTYFARREEMQVDLGKEAQRLLINYPWYGNIRELENFITSLSIQKKSIVDTDIYSLLENATDFFDTFKQEEMPLHQLEREYIGYLLKKYKNKAQTARILGISRKSLYNKLNSYES